MAEKSIGNSNYSDLKKSIHTYSDNEVIIILKKRKQIAVKEAINRGLINSDQDLYAKEFNEEVVKSTLFPKINTERNRNKIRKSIARGLLIAGTIPAVWGVFGINEGRFFEGILLILLGAIWIYASAHLMRSVSLKMIKLVFIMLLASVAYIVKLILEMKNLAAMDFVIPIVLVSFVTYGLLYIRKLSD